MTPQQKHRRRQALIKAGLPIPEELRPAPRGQKTFCGLAVVLMPPNRCYKLAAVNYRKNQIEALKKRI